MLKEMSVDAMPHSHWRSCYWAILVTAFCFAAPALAEIPAATQPAQENTSTAALPVGVVDIDRVARDIGWMTSMEANLKAYQKMLQGDIKEAAETYNQQIKAVVQPMRPAGVDPQSSFTLTPAQNQEIMPYLAAQRQTLQSLSQKAEQQFTSYRSRWIKDCRDALAPVVRSVAKDNKLLIVFQRGDSILYVDDQALDITAAVVKAAQTTPPVLTVVPMDHLLYPSKLEVAPTAPTAPPAKPIPADQP